MPLARAWADLAADDPASAAIHLDRCARIGERGGDHVPEAAVLHLLGRIGHARRVRTRIDALAATSDSALLRAQEHHVRALAAGDSAELEAAAIEFDRLGARAVAAEAAGQAAVSWLSAGRARDATRTQRMTVEFHPGQPGLLLTRRRPPPEVTLAERGTALLAATGRSNKQIAAETGVSIRTVENRLQRTYQKLGISSSSQIRAALQPAAEFTTPAAPAKDS